MLSRHRAWKQNSNNCCWHAAQCFLLNSFATCWSRCLSWHWLSQQHLSLCFPFFTSACVCVCMLYLKLYMYEPRLWKHCLVGCVCARFDSVGQDVVSLIHTHTHPMHFASLWTTWRAASQRSRAVPFDMWCNFICVHITWKISSAGWLITYFLSPVKLPFTSFTPLFLPPPPRVSPYTFTTFCLSLLCSLSAFSLTFSTLHAFPNCLYTSFLLPLSCSKSTGFTFTHLLSSQSLLFWVNASSVTAVCIHTQTREWREGD